MRPFSTLLLVAALTLSATAAAVAPSSPLAKRDTQIDANHDSAPRHYGERWFYTRSGGVQNETVLYVADSLDGAPRSVLASSSALTSSRTCGEASEPTSHTYRR